MDQKEEIKQKLDIVDVVGSYVPIKKSGRNYKSVCPFHSEKTPSFMVSPELQIYKCFGCGVSGDIYSFVQEIEGVDFSRSMEILAERAGVKLIRRAPDTQAQLRKKIYRINELSTKFYNYLLLEHKSGKKALSYLKKDRKLKEDTIKEFMIGYAPNSWDTLHKYLLSKGIKDVDMVAAGVVIKKQKGEGFIDKFRGRIVFPLTSVDKKVLAFTGRTAFDRKPKYLNTSETPVFHKTNFLYGLDKNRVNIKKEGAVFVEGQMDLISAWQEGIKNLVTVSGTSLTDNQLRILSRYTQDVTFSFDSDFAGVTASLRAIELAEKQGFNIKIAIVPEPHKDLDELIHADLSLAKKILKDAVGVFDFFLVTALKRNNKKTALGKKKIMEELVPIFSKITNQVLLDHYAKEVTEELGLSLETVYSMFKKGSVGKERDYEFVEESDQIFPVDKRKPEAHFIALLLKVPIDIAKEYISKVEPKDFLSDMVRGIFEKLSKYIGDRKTDINVKSLLNKLDEEEGSLVSDLFMWDIEGLDENKEEILERDLKGTVERIKKDAIKREQSKLTEEIKLAEKEKNISELEKLTKRFERLSKGLI
ncbi:DNA primase [Patescibacteria group bacterium]